MSSLITKKRIIVIGGGFAGIQFVKKIDHDLFDVLLIDKINHHQFQPLFYQVATSQLEPSSISFPLRHVLKGIKNLQIRLAEVLSIDAKANKVNTSIGPFEYDHLVIAIGCKTNFYNNENIEKYSFSLKTTYEAIALRNHILRTFERVLSCTEKEREGLLNFVIVGAGPTGVELAGALSEIRKDILPKDYPGIDFSEFRIMLVEGSKNTLNSMSENARAASKDYLQKMAVIIRTETLVDNYDGSVITFKNGGQIKTNTVIWAAGVKANNLNGLPESCYGVGGRLKVNRINMVVESENIYAVGDIAYMETPLYPKGHPQLANVAINQAKNLANNLRRIYKNDPVTDFEYKDLGSMATIGRNKAVVDLPFIKFKGYIAWLTWMFLHLMLILSVKNKLFIFINWALAYITKDTSLRLILSQNKKQIKI